MKKFEIHLFTEDSSKGKRIKFSIGKLLWIGVGICCAIIGFIVFSPAELFNKITNRQIIELYKESNQLKQSIKSTEDFLAEAKGKLEQTKYLKDSLFEKPLMKHIQKQDTPRIESSKEKIPELKANRSRLLEHFEKAPKIAKSLPVFYPIEKPFTITNRYQNIYDPFTEQELPHRGIDFAVARNDTVFAPGAGVVSEAKMHRGLGLTLKISHTENIRTVYAHLERVLKPVGGHVERGEPLAIIGESGRSLGKVLHYEIRYDGVTVNPEDFILDF